MMVGIKRCLPWSWPIDGSPDLGILMEYRRIVIELCRYA